jgi:hypothetical protein
MPRFPAAPWRRRVGRPGGKAREAAGYEAERG